MIDGGRRVLMPNSAMLMLGSITIWCLRGRHGRALDARLLHQVHGSQEREGYKVPLLVPGTPRCVMRSIASSLNSVLAPPPELHCDSRSIFT